MHYAREASCNRRDKHCKTFVLFASDLTAAFGKRCMKGRGVLFTCCIAKWLQAPVLLALHDVAVQHESLQSERQ